MTATPHPQLMEKKSPVSPRTTCATEASPKATSTKVPKASARNSLTYMFWMTNLGLGGPNSGNWLGSAILEMLALALD